LKSKTTYATAKETRTNTAKKQEFIDFSLTIDKISAVSKNQDNNICTKITKVHCTASKKLPYYSKPPWERLIVEDEIQVAFVGDGACSSWGGDLQERVHKNST